MTSFHPRTSISIIIQVIQDDGAISLLLSFSLLFFPSFFSLLFFPFFFFSCFFFIICSLYFGHHLFALFWLLFVDWNNIISTAMNAVCLALLDAGLPLHFVPISITCAVNDGSTILMDPTESEEKVCLLLNLHFISSLLLILFYCILYFILFYFIC